VVEHFIKEVRFAMRTTLFTLAWIFVLGVATYDVYFAWQYRVAFQTWEMNPMARWMARFCGLGGVVALKSALIVFAVGVAAYCHRLRHRLEIPYTLFVSGVHLVLSLHYLLGQLRTI
jgi:hypothetical protein